MDPVSVGLLLAVAGGMGTGIGEQAWHGLSTLVHRPLHHDAPDTSPTRATETGIAQVRMLEQDPADQDAAAVLTRIIALRAATDAGFRSVLETWLATTRRTYTCDASVHNSISGGTFHQPVIQSGAIENVSIGEASTPTPSAKKASD